jgi:hypothetical protein
MAADRLAATQAAAVDAVQVLLISLLEGLAGTAKSPAVAGGNAGKRQSRPASYSRAAGDAH